MNTLFRHILRFSEDFFVADYTQPAADDPTNTDLQGRGVEITDTLPVVDALWFQNPRKVDSSAVNFEHNGGVFTNTITKQKISQCECCCFACKGMKPWFVFIELKYPKLKNVIDNASHAWKQVKDTHLFLLKNYDVLQKKKYHFYYAVAIPPHGQESPFLASIITQDELISLKKERISLLDTNEIEILNESYLKKVDKSNS